MRDCPNVQMRERLPELLHNVLPASVAADVRAHVAQCADCGAELAMLEKARAALAAPRVNTARIVAKLPRYQRPSIWMRAMRSTELRAAAAVVLAIGGLAVIRMGSAGDPIPDTAVALAPAPAATGAAEIAIGDTFQDLSDGDLRAMLEEIAKLEAVTPAALDDDVPAVVEPAARNGTGGAEG